MTVDMIKALIEKRILDAKANEDHFRRVRQHERADEANAILCELIELQGEILHG